MITINQCVDVISRSPVKELIDKLSLQEKTAEKLKYGFVAKFKNEKDLRSAKALNSIYESLVWGHVDDADNDRVCNDEKSVIRDFFKESVYGTHLLEVGCGSGRISKELLHASQSFSVLDREPAVIRRIRSILSKQGRSVSYNIADFSKRVALPHQHSAVVLMENLLGMNPMAPDRIRIIRNAFQLLRSKGIAVFGVRVRSDIKSGIEFQAMPYSFAFQKVRRRIFGIAINWSKNGFIDDVCKSGIRAKLVEWRVGNPRPAGGRMAFAILQKD